MTRLTIGVRWLFLVPVVIVAAILAHAAMVLAWKVGAFYVDQDSLLSKGYLYLLANMVSGYAGIHAAHKIAPTHKQTGVVLGLISLTLLAGFSVAGVLVGNADRTDLIGIGLMVVGAAFATVALLRGDAEYARDTTSGLESTSA